jgi:hypothetical protein
MEVRFFLLFQSTDFHAPGVTAPGVFLFAVKQSSNKGFKTMSVGTTYSIGVAAEAARTIPRKIRNLIDTNVTPLRANDLKAQGSGSRIGLSRNRILQIAEIVVLLKSGVSLSNAAKAALQFSDRASTGREAGELYEHGKSVLVIGPEGATVKNILYDATLADVSHGVCTITVDLNRIVESVDSTLKEAR